MRLMAPPDAAPLLPADPEVWLREHVSEHRIIRSVMTALADLQAAGCPPGAINALRRILACHQPTARGRCRTCHYRWLRHRPFPCVVWMQVRGELLGAFGDCALSAGQGRLGRHDGSRPS
jgi:hypothetical protein